MTTTPTIERARSRRPVTWLTLVGVLLLPVVIGGILVAALYNPVERLDGVKAAIVNEDEGVTIDGQQVPLGRQLTAGLVEGSDDLPSNLDWTISNADDAAEGLKDGSYAAVITIPSNFSAAATSTRPGETPERATIDVKTPPDSLIVDDAITAQVATAAASVMGEQLSSVYLENVFLGFTTLGDQLGDAASGASELADGAGSAAEGSRQLADGFPQLSSGASGLASGASQLAGGFPQFSSGASGLSSGASQLQSGLGDLASGARQAASGADQLAAGVTQGAADLEAAGIVPDRLTQAANGAATATGLAEENASAAAATLKELAASCTQSQDFCTKLGEAALSAGTASVILAGDGTETNPGAVTLTKGTADGLTLLAQQAPTQIADQFRTIAANIASLGSGIGQLATGADQSAAGAGQLASGATQLSNGLNQAGTGAGELASGASQLAGGLDEAGAGAVSLADGVQQLADGTGELASGLSTAVDEIPTYTDAEASSLADVVADPVEADGVGTSLFGASAIPLLAMLALWFGGLGTFVALQAVSRRALAAREPSIALALRSFLPAAALGAAQGLLVAGVVQVAASYDWGQWWGFAGVAVVAGVAFAAVNQALVAVFGGAGRWIAALVGVLAVATGIVSTVPGVLASLASLLPTSPAYHGMVAALTSATGGGAAVAGLVIWTLLAFGATILAVARRRTTTARAILKAAPATA